MWQEEKENPPPKQLEEDIFKNLHILELLGETMELYLPQAAEMFVEMLGGSVTHPELDDLPMIGGRSDKDEDEPPMNDDSNFE